MVARVRVAAQQVTGGVAGLGARGEGGGGDERAAQVSRRRLGWRRSKVVVQVKVVVQLGLAVQVSERVAAQQAGVAAQVKGGGKG